MSRSISWGNHGCLTVVTSWHTLQIGVYIRFLGVSHYAWALALLSSHMHLELVCVWARDRCMCGLNPAPSADNVHRWFGFGPPLLLLREEPLWKFYFFDVLHNLSILCNVLLHSTNCVNLVMIYSAHQNPFTFRIEHLGRILATPYSQEDSNLTYLLANARGSKN